MSAIEFRLDIFLDSGYIVAVMSNVAMDADFPSREIGRIFVRIGMKP